ncbi:hypothetical protein A5893_12005 [Pedobacter psychrophilus]|uniref:Pappalysin-1 SD scarf domain-containing protein n=1 Tax=Pedobacter psychrophilus TaxID=1826909 RepID=A0A179DCJ5_9SPHI|nr:hypothetical protein [Pedobacter psychrophilus]OAQ38765.1 hypothetical protein A5893_12005 [Pedobacter psychrophilus]
MKKFIILLFLFPAITFGQQVQWVTKVIKSSSDLGGKQYSSRRIIGKPDVFPQGGDSPNAWAPKNAQDGHDFIEVEFEKAQTVKQIAIFENLNTGCFVKVLAGTGDGKYKEVYRSTMSYMNNDMGVFHKAGAEGRTYYFGRKRRKVNEASDVNNKPGIEYAKLQEPLENVKALKIVFNFQKTEGDKQIDAIGISDSDIPIVADVNTRQEFEKLDKPVSVYTSKNYFHLEALRDNKLYLSLYNDSYEKSKINYLDISNTNNLTLTQLPESINKNPYHNYIGAIIDTKFITGSADYKKGTSETGFNVYKQSGENFTEEKPIQIVAYNNFDNVADLTASKDGSIIVMAIESDISQGGMDLYSAKIKDDGTYSLLQNFGKNVNSANNELLPFLCDDDKTLFFISNGISSYGNEDIYYSVRLDDTWKKWSDPINLGKIINDEESQGSMVYDSKNENFYYQTFKDGNYQIMKVKLPKSYLSGN